MENQASLTHKVLASGDKMPSVGYGCWKVPGDVLPECVYQAIKAGYRLFDEAADYGNEKECGAGIKRAIDEGLVKREDLFITSKLWNTNHRKEHVKAACKKSMADLGLEYLDLYLIHFPIPLKHVPVETRYPPEWFFDPSAENPKLEEDKVPYQETWKAMEELHAEGLVKNIGVSNIGCQTLRDVLSYCKVHPAVLQIELHPYNTMEKLVRYAKERNMAVTAYSTFGGGSYVELGMCKEQDAVWMEPLLKGIAEKHGKTAPQIALRWALQRGTAIIPKSIKPERMIENMSIFDWELTDEEMASIAALNKGRRFNDPGFFCEAAFNTYFPIHE